MTASWAEYVVLPSPLPTSTSTIGLFIKLSSSAAVSNKLARAQFVWLPYNSALRGTIHATITPYDLFSFLS
jgi:hypothetical protein